MMILIVVLWIVKVEFGIFRFQFGGGLRVYF